jgi:hypothetical protein
MDPSDEDEQAYMKGWSAPDPLARLREEFKARGLYRPQAPRRHRPRHSRRCVFVAGTSLKATDHVLCECRSCRKWVATNQEMKTKSAR